MRIKEEFAKQRKSEVIQYKPKYFIVSEGSCTEPDYFDGLNSLVIKQNVTIVNIFRDYLKDTNSHPIHIIKIIEDFIINSKDGKITVRELKNKLDNFQKDTNNIDVDIEVIKNEISNNYGDEESLTMEEAERLFVNLFKGKIYKKFTENFVSYFDRQNITYSPITDKINMVVDRDKQNFKEDQYDEVVKFCKNNNVNLYVSNPTFEFWLMLHFKDVETENKSEMYNNEKVSRKKRYLEKRLNDICGYNKSNLDFKKFESNIDDAINREKMFEESIDKLKNELGTNVGILVENIKKAK